MTNATADTMQSTETAPPSQIVTRSTFLCDEVKRRSHSAKGLSCFISFLGWFGCLSLIVTAYKRLGYRARAKSRPWLPLKIVSSHGGCVHLNTLPTNMIRTRTTPSNAIGPPNHFATASIFSCDEAKRVSHFMLEPPGRCRWHYLRPAKKSVQSHA